MSDITLCEGFTCPFKDKCYRYTAKRDPLIQSYFSGEPRNEDGTCDFYYPIFENIENIIENEGLISEWGGILCAIIDGKKKNIADHLNELERKKEDVKRSKKEGFLSFSDFGIPRHLDESTSQDP